MKNLTITIFFLTAIAFGSCQRTVIEGKILDGFGKPVNDATVKVEGTQFTSQTDDNGEYSVGYVPGDIKVLISKQGFTDTSFTVKISTEATFPAEATTIYAIPPSEGVFLMQDGKYSLLSKGSISSQKFNTGDVWFMREKYVYSVSYDPANVTSIKKQQTELILFDHDPRPLSLLQIQNSNGQGGGTLLERSVNNGGMGFAMGDYGDKAVFPKVNYVNLNAQHCGLRYYNLDIGDYAIVQYQKKNSNAIVGDAFVFRVIN